MKNLLLGMILGLLMFPLLADISEIVGAEFPNALTMPGYGISEVAKGKCTKDVGENGHGWKFVLREYYDCNKLQIAISDLVYGEYTQGKQ